TAVTAGAIGAQPDPLRALPDPPPFLHGEEVVADLDGELERRLPDVLHPGDARPRSLGGYDVFDALLNAGRLAAAEADVVFHDENPLDQGAHQTFAKTLGHPAFGRPVRARIGRVGGLLEHRLDAPALDD